MTYHNSKIGSQLSNTKNQVEQTVVMIKPGFTKFLNIETMITNYILQEAGINLRSIIKGTMSKEQAMEFYCDKKDKDFYQELVDYMSSDEIVGFIFEGEGAIKKVRRLAEELRDILKKCFAIKNDVMKNIIHATNIKMIENAESTIDSQREIKILENIRRI